MTRFLPVIAAYRFFRNAIINGEPFTVGLKILLFAGGIIAAGTTVTLAEDIAELARRYRQRKRTPALANSPAVATPQRRLRCEISGVSRWPYLTIIAVLVGLVIVLTSAVARLENYRYANFAGRCTDLPKSTIGSACPQSLDVSTSPLLGIGSPVPAMVR